MTLTTMAAHAIPTTLPVHDITPIGNSIWRDSPYNYPGAEALPPTPPPSISRADRIEIPRVSIDQATIFPSEHNLSPNANANIQSDIESAYSQSESEVETIQIEPLKLSISYYAQLRAQGDVKKDIEKVNSTPTTANYITAFFIDVVFRQIYWHLLLRVPEVYWSRVLRILQDADIPIHEVASVVSQARSVQSSASSSRYTLPMIHAKDCSERFAQLNLSWEHFLDSAMREWKIMNLVSVLLLGAIASLLQIDLVVVDPLVRTAAFVSMVCALMSLLYGCMYSIRFFDLRKSYKALQWAEDARKNQLNPFWNVWVFLALPAIWLVWSLVAYLVCIMAYVWRVGNEPTIQTSQRRILELRIMVTCVLFLGLIYLCLTISTLRQYGGVMEDKWRAKATLFSKTNIQGFIPGYDFDYPDSASAIYHSSPTTPQHSQLSLIDTYRSRHLQQPTYPHHSTRSPRNISHFSTSEIPLKSAMKKNGSLSALRPHRVAFSDSGSITSEGLGRRGSLASVLFDTDEDLTTPDLINTPTSENRDHEYFSHRPQEAEASASLAHFQTTKVLSLDPTQFIDPAGFTPELDIKPEDWNTFVQDLNRVWNPSDLQALDTSPEADLQQREQLFGLLNAWNDPFFSSRGVEIICCSESPKDQSQPLQYSLYLCDLDRPRGEGELRPGEFDADRFESVRILVQSVALPQDPEDDDIEDS
ncbi:hypothetical protein BDN72DRAFT_879516 [Pluteus cervinus]|uniref:Uncharacterized protein n=1 Tax=Pluteus cervinus TaxID=181527 RepID=A0ACD3AQU9_9AGAR|nr:hypothetical protein BDN72DRAFT_879516 [Pluteus cervinus]